MENIETLLAAVAQTTQGFDDDDDVVVDVNAPSLGFHNSPVEKMDVDVDATAPTAIGSGDKRKRGRPGRGQLVVKPPPPKRKKQEDGDEDVCFICFDGGSLVLCDRKGCPKAYHPACIKRDEAFFQTKAKWNCGWHICSICRRGSHYLCYTCTYSLCKTCTRDADYVSVRGNKGFCATCMKTIMLIENKDQANEDSVKVDFDDKTSWEYLFKVYWVLLKEKYSLTLTELTQAKKPWKGVATMACKPQSRNVHQTALNGEAIPYRSSERLELNKPNEEISLLRTDGSKEFASSIGNHVETRISEKEEYVPHKDAHKPSMDRLSADKGADEPLSEKAVGKLGIVKNGISPSIVEDTNTPYICRNTDDANNKDQEKPGVSSSSEWASKELLEFVAHIKNGDTSVLSQLDVQILLLNYIKRKNLRDPRQKSQIVCDRRLANLFGRARVGHIEMLKLLESHFLIKEDSQKNSFIPAGFVGSSDKDVDGNNDGVIAPIKSRKRKTCKKIEERAPQNNLNEYAAIDFHNINLIYLRRTLMENLIDDKENFSEKVFGSIVRIKISSNDQKPVVHRLVQVVGTSKVPEPYKCGDRTADIMLEVLNLDKKETVSIDSISNQDFTEDECKRLRQSIRCGLMKQFTVGDIQNKALALQPLRLNDWLESEILRVKHLRDRASEKGHKKELREYVQKLQLLKSPEERQRRMSEVPVIHADPKMSPNYESEEDTKSVNKSKKDEYLRPGYSGFAQSVRMPISSSNKGKGKSSIKAQNPKVDKKDANRSHCLRKHTNLVDINNSAIGRGADQAMQRSDFETSTATASVRDSLSASHVETEKLWHYRDPNSKIQGPFSMMQLRKWSTTGLFPPDMRIWTNHEQYDSLLLVDALNGRFHGASEKLHNSASERLHNSSLEQLHNSASERLHSSSSERLNNSSSEQLHNSASERLHSSSSEQLNSSSSEHLHNSALERLHSSSSEHLHNSALGRLNSSSSERLNSSSSERLNSSSSELLHNSSSGTQKDAAARGIGETLGVDEAGGGSKHIETTCSKHSIDLAESTDGSTRADETCSPSWPQCWDLLKDNKNSSADHIQACNVLPSSSPRETSVEPSDRGQESVELNHGSQNGEKNLSGLSQNQIVSTHELPNESDDQGQALLSSEDNLRTLPIDLMRSNDIESESAFAAATDMADAIKIDSEIDVSDLHNHTPKASDEHLEQNTEEQRCLSPDVPVQTTEFLELLSPAPRSNNADQGVQETERNQSGFIDFPMSSPGPSWNNGSDLVVSAQLPDVADEWCGYSPTPAKPLVQEWDPGFISTSSLRPLEVTGENVAISTSSNSQLINSTSNPAPSFWRAMLNEPIEFDALGEESVSDLLAEVDAMESQGAFSPTSDMKFAREFIQEYKDDCFSSIEDFSPTAYQGKSEVLSSSGEVQLTAHSSVQCNHNEATPSDALDSFRRSGVYSSASSEGETNAPVHSREAGSEFQPPAPNNTSQDMGGAVMPVGTGSEFADPGWGTVQGNINLVTVQGNVNLVLGGHTQGMANIGWGTNPGPAWANPNINRNPVNGGSLPWDNQRKYSGERFASPRDRAYQGGEPGFGRGRPPWSRQPYGGGGYSRPPPKGQRVCKFYESGRCKKGAFCDYLHP